MFCAKGEGERQVGTRVPLVLAVECKIVESDSLRNLRSEGLEQLRKIGAWRSRIHATLIKGIKRLGDQEARSAEGVLLVAPIDALEVCAEADLLIAPISLIDRIVQDREPE